MRDLIRRHITHTGSDHAARILEAWRNMSALFVKVMPRDYKRVLAAQARGRRRRAPGRVRGAGRGRVAESASGHLVIWSLVIDWSIDQSMLDNQMTR